MTCQARFSPSLRASALAGVVALGWLVAAPTAVVAQDGGYFSGVRFGQSGKAWSFTAPGLKLGQALEYSRGSDAGNTAFSGYQFENGLALGAALNTDRSEALIRSSLGLKFDGMRWTESRPNVNVDVVSAFNWRNSLSVFGKLGVGRGDNRLTPEWASASASALDRTAISYGVGVRYDITSSLGLKLELTRGTRFGMDRLRTDVDGDAVNFGIRWSF
ncbi:MAG TPA: outer membrane beta-barrel protein [Casimicrobium huifangae]|jgi:opacity protein-like surface antigen|uniref:outer membrane protein n=1 Tax=Casimicrobium huifangae TaxID=2591109 RepID=UPI002BDCE889|nr:outer membrane beta-barrel protein [Casimicrobium huifangae]HQA34753.1 outer membrane beta-barrel protein [Casimicrobium huifangae]HQD63713.1 outer membrane beta-barrel protein [Casimicrobium huifangae]